MRRLCRAGFILAGLLFAAAVFSFPEPYALFKLAAWFALAVCAGRYAPPRFVLGSLAGLGILEALLDFFQFATHKSLGLSFLGEPALGPLNGAVARTFVHGGRLMRAYGTFPHPNILAAFLVLSLVAWAHFFLARRRTVVSVLGIFIVLLGLLLTFSRSGWIAACVATLIVLADARTRVPARAKELFLVLAVSCASLALIFPWAVVPRLSVGAGDYAVTGRVSGYEAAFPRIGSHPLFGGGLTLRMGSDPVHSLYLMIADELGFFGLAVFLLLVGSALMRGARRKTSEFAAFSAMLAALLTMGVTDHFLWTLRPGIAMLFLVIGMLAFSDNVPSHS